MKKTKKYKKHKKKNNTRNGLIILLVLTIVLIGIKIAHPGWLSGNYFERESDSIEEWKPDIDVQLLTVNPYSRPGIEVGKIKGIVLHYTANPGSSAQANRDYFEGLKDTHLTKTSSNFVIGLDGEIIQCVPTWEMAYASNERNKDTVSIECCHPDESGEFSEETYASMVHLSAWLCMKFDLNEKDLIRHYDITGKNCPKYFVENEKTWETFREDVGKALAKAR